MNNIKNFFIYLLHNEIRLFQQEKVSSYLLYMSRFILSKIIYLVNIFLGAFGLITLSMAYSSITAEMTTVEIITTLRTSVCPVSIVWAFLCLAVRETFHLFRYLKFHWNSYGLHHE
ncbi:hypothetical protein [[Haemophilus] ducreyi]|uniref:hypothetical protein n=1 Tax=Haemophilus ducreyi TaxID=730 RepID=UPI0007CDC038|nr:hypothetical protein [[Haemophilus] ducreyi]ANF71843.1 hypothetical protein A6044_02615 [[Haemophilus] ducreyi]